jgi:ADP-ribose pyrophosphatase YjhB (NUDIX family)
MTQKKFVPRENQVDFTNARYCPVINCVLEHEGKILLVKRSEDMNLYPGYWNGVSGFLDDKQDLEEKARHEIRDETGIKDSDIVSVKVGNILVQEAKNYGRTWIIFPILVKVKSDKVRLDWEASEYKWIKPKDAKKLKLLPGFDQVLASFF